MQNLSTLDPSSKKMRQLNTFPHNVKKQVINLTQ